MTFPGNIVVVTGSNDSDDFSDFSEGESDSEFGFFPLGLIILKNQ